VASTGENEPPVAVHAEAIRLAERAEPRPADCLVPEIRDPEGGATSRANRPRMGVLQGRQVIVDGHVVSDGSGLSNVEQCRQLGLQGRSHTDVAALNLPVQEA
jgi:hypothetical protein